MCSCRILIASCVVSCQRTDLRLQAAEKSLEEIKRLRVTEAQLGAGQSPSSPAGRSLARLPGLESGGSGSPGSLKLSRPCSGPNSPGRAEGQID